MNLTPIINAIIALAAVLITSLLIPWVKRKVAASDLEELQVWVKIAVAAAEQLYTSLQGEEKLQYALDFLAAKGYDVNTDEIRNTIEAAVLQLHNALYGTEKVLE